jgi:hypothetical protein
LSCCKVFLTTLIDSKQKIIQRNCKMVIQKMKSMGSV